MSFALVPRSADQVNAMPIGPPTGEAASWPSGCGVRPEMAEFLERIAKLSPKRLALLAADLQAKDVLEAGGAGCPPSPGD